MQLTANVNRQLQSRSFNCIFHVKHGWESFRGRLLEARSRLDQKETRRLKPAEFVRKISAQLGDRTLSPNTLKGWEEGAIPNIENVAAISVLCGVHPSWLAFGLGDPDDPAIGKISIRGDYEPDHPPIRKTTKRKLPTPAQKAAAARRTSGGKRAG
jgi:hypothetical protein